MTGGSFHGPPLPLLLVPIVVQLVRSSRDPKMTAYLKELSKGGPKAIADNAHKIAQYALSKVPSSVLYWFVSRVLALPAETALQTTEFLKSRSDLEILLGQDAPLLQIESSSEKACASASDIERRLEKLELDYQVLQENHKESLSFLTCKPENMVIPVSTTCLKPRAESALLTHTTERASTARVASNTAIRGDHSRRIHADRAAAAIPSVPADEPR